jgi:hypothetical protein
MICLSLSVLAARRSIGARGSSTLLPHFSTRQFMSIWCRDRASRDVRVLLPSRHKNDDKYLCTMPAYTASHDTEYLCTMPAYMANHDTRYLCAMPAHTLHHASRQKILPPVASAKIDRVNLDQIRNQGFCYGLRSRGVRQAAVFLKQTFLPPVIAARAQFSLRTEGHGCRTEVSACFCTLV